MHSTGAVNPHAKRHGPDGLPALALVAALALAGCSGGTDAMTQAPLVPRPATDLDTTRQPPQTVTSTPLLPPVPEDAAPRPATAEEPPLQYDQSQLYSDEEQLRIKTDLAAAAARMQKN